MSRADLTTEQREELERREESLAWLQGGFRQYADLCGYLESEIDENIRAQINMYSEEFGRVLRGEVILSRNEELGKLQNDLQGLKQSGCPAQALAEMMLACTSDYGVIIPDLLRRAEELQERECFWPEDNLGFPTTPCPTIQGLPGERPIRGFPRLRRVRLGIPLSIQFMAETIAEPADSRTRHHLAYFYCLLKHFGYGHEFLAHLLRVMQRVRRNVPAIVDYLQTGNKDTFTYGNVQRRVCRFFEAYPASENSIEQQIHEYLSGAGGVSGDRKTILDMVS
jgi:hypothetical protein